jgi:glycosyltransferase involved in cell wall biosynthesis
MSSELVAVGSNVGGIFEIIQDPELLVDPLNTDDMVRKMSEVLEMSSDE